MPEPETHRRLGRAAITLALAATLTGCAGLPGGPAAPRGVPGFDTRDYPGAAALRAWRDASPYRWVGFYLPAPCYTGTTWLGKRPEIEAIGWGWAVLFVGEQDWTEIPGTPSGAVPPDPTAPRCTRANLTAEQGALDATAAATSAAAEGFPPGTVVYLDVERVERVSAALVAYVAAWAGGVLADGRFLPGLYAHGRNAEELTAVMAAAFARAGRPGAPRLWLASGEGFDLNRSPAESGVAWATVWQGAFDVRETWGGVTLRIDANVARSQNPSR